MCRCVAQNLFVNDVFDLANLFCSHRAGVNKVKAGTIAVNHRASLLNVLTEHFTQRLVHQVRHRVVSGCRFSVFFINFGAEKITDFDTAFGDIAHMTKHIRFDLEGVVNFQNSCIVFKDALVAHLTAAFSVERSFVKDNNNFISGICVFHRLAVFVDCFYTTGVNREGFVAEEFRRAPFIFKALSHLEFTGRSGFFTLFFHRRVKAFEVNRHASFTADVRSQVNREAIGVVKLKRDIASENLGSVSKSFVKNIKTLGKRLGEANFFLTQDFFDMRITGFRILIAHFFGDRFNQLAEEEITGAKFEAVTHTAASNTAKHVAAAFIAGKNSVSNDKGTSTNVVSNDFDRRRIRIDVFTARFFNRLNHRTHQVLEKVNVIVGMNMLQNRRNTLKSHAGINARTGQRMHFAFFITIELHEHEVPNFNVTVAVFVGASRRTSGDILTVVVENFRARAAWTCVAHHPEVVGSVTSAFVVADTNDSFSRNADFLVPNVIGFIVFRVHGDPKLFRRKHKVLCQQLPCVLNRIALEIITKAEIAEHFKESMVTGGIADVFQVIMFSACANTLLTGRRTFVGTLVKSKENILELVHTGIREEQSRIISGNNRAGGNNRMPLGLHKLQKCRSNF